MTDHLIDHKYTVFEIEAMRAAVKKLLSQPAVRDPNLYPLRDRKARPLSVYFVEPKPEPVEMQLRTYMLAGIRPQELEARASEYERTERKKWEAAFVAKNTMIYGDTA